MPHACPLVQVGFGGGVWHRCLAPVPPWGLARALRECLCPLAPGPTTTRGVAGSYRRAAVRAACDDAHRVALGPP